MKTASGIITLVQEHRFQLESDNGRHLLFILAHDAKQEWEDLKRLEKENCHVVVRYTDSEKLIASTAHEIWQGQERAQRHPTGKIIQ